MNIKNLSIRTVCVTLALGGTLMLSSCDYNTAQNRLYGDLYAVVDGVPTFVRQDNSMFYNNCSSKHYKDITGGVTYHEITDESPKCLCNNCLNVEMIDIQAAANVLTEEELQDTNYTTGDFMKTLYRLRTDKVGKKYANN